MAIQRNKIMIRIIWITVPEFWVFWTLWNFTSSCVASLVSGLWLAHTLESHVQRSGIILWSQEEILKNSVLFLEAIRSTRLFAFIQVQLLNSDIKQPLHSTLKDENLNTIVGANVVSITKVITLCKTSQRMSLFSLKSICRKWNNYDFAT